MLITVTSTSRRAEPCTLQASNVLPDHQRALLGAFNATNLASSYIERGNFAAARRKLVLALQAVDQLRAEG